MTVTNCLANPLANRPAAVAAVLLLSVLGAGCVQQSTPAPAAAHPALPAEVLALVDRAAIEDMLVAYYAQLGSGRHDFGTYFAADGVIDIDGQVAQGQEAIEKLYAEFAAASPPEPGTFRMVLSNIRVVVNGDTATADSMWTGIHSATLTALPRVVEQGREHDELVKVDGTWKFKHRVITSDGGMDQRLLKDYVKR